MYYVHTIHLQNVYLTGGTSLLPNFAERLTVDLRSMRPYQSSFSVIPAPHKTLDAWRGASSWGGDERNSQWFVSRAEYEENGSEYLKEHSASNPYITPLNS